MMEVKKLDRQELEDMTGTTGGAVIEFYADWCGPCKMMAPVLEEVAQERNDLLFGKVNVDEEATAAQKYGISSVPTVLIFRGGMQWGQIVGLVGKSKVQSALREAGL